LGLATLFIFRRGLEYFPWFVGYLLLAWLVAVVLAGRRRVLVARGHRVTGMVVEYAVQSLLHGLLLFLLPIYYASTTLASRNVWLFLLLAVAAIVTTIDPWYRAIVLRFRGGEFLLFAFGLSASLFVALPLVGLSNPWTLWLSGVVCALALAPAIRGGSGASWRGTLVLVAVGGAGAAVLFWIVREWIPPVPLHLTRATFARSVSRMEPVQPVDSVSTAVVRDWGGIVSFSSVAAPAGLRESIYHVWRKDGTTVDRVSLSPIRGGRPGGFRTYSRKTDLGQNPAGRWSVDVVTAHGQLVGRLRLIVTP
jgi:hypothetical protein